MLLNENMHIVGHDIDDMILGGKRGVFESELFFECESVGIMAGRVLKCGA